MDETLPFMKPMGSVGGEELDAADREWSRWLAFEDWMVGPRAVEEDGKRNVREQSSHQAYARGGMGGVERDVHGNSQGGAERDGQRDGQGGGQGHVGIKLEEEAVVDDGYTPL